MSGYYEVCLFNEVKCVKNLGSDCYWSEASAVIRHGTRTFTNSKKIGLKSADFKSPLRSKEVKFTSRNTHVGRFSMPTQVHELNVELIRRPAPARTKFIVH